MIFKRIQIKNFRNFEWIDVALSNRNVFFGMNDVGKTNFLYALRYVFDKEIRKNGLTESDFHQKNVDETIEITIEIDVSDNNQDSQKIFAALRESRSEKESLFIKLEARFNQQEAVTLPELYWGDGSDNLREMKQRKYLYEIDHLFNVVYIDSYVNLYTLFNKNIRELVKNTECIDENTVEQDSEIRKQIDVVTQDLNKKISSLSVVKQFEERISSEYKLFKDEPISISVKSEIAVKGLFSNLIPYINMKQNGNEDLYPTAGEGRKKLITYSIFSLLAKVTEEKKINSNPINLFLIEEPENHLHKAMQIALSQCLFASQRFSYLFVTTHSPFILYEMDDVNLVRIYNHKRITSASVVYNVPGEFKTNRKILNRTLSEAIFANSVLLVEGPSEQILFEKVLSVVRLSYEFEGGYVLPVMGISFERYLRILSKLKINTFIKTDNDLRELSPIGFERCNKLIEVIRQENNIKDSNEQLPIEKQHDKTIESKRSMYKKNLDILDNIREKYQIFLSKVDLENDLYETLGEKLTKYLKENPVKYLQEKKQIHMVEFVNKLSDNNDDDKLICQTICDDYNFACLKKFIGSLDNATN